MNRLGKSMGSGRRKKIYWLGGRRSVARYGMQELMRCEFQHFRLRHGGALRVVTDKGDRDSGPKIGEWETQLSPWPCPGGGGLGESPPRCCCCSSSSSSSSTRLLLVLYSSSLFSVYIKTGPRPSFSPNPLSLSSSKHPPPVEPLPSLKYTHTHTRTHTASSSSL